MITRLFMTLAGLLTLTGVGVLGFRPVAHADEKVEGTWLVDVNIVTCPPAPPAVIVTFKTMLTFMPSGVLIESGSPPSPAPAVSRSAGHGIWEKTGPNTIRTSFRFHSFDNLGRLVRIAEIAGNSELIQGDNPETPDVEPYYFSGVATNKFTNIDPVTGTVINVIDGCSESKGRPVLFED